MAVAAVVARGDLAQHAQLIARKQTVRHRDAQHVRMTLHVQTILQTQRAEFVFRQFLGKEAPGLIAELVDPFAHNTAVIVIVAIHDFLRQKAISFAPIRTSIPASMGRNTRSEIRTARWLPR